MRKDIWKKMEVEQTKNLNDEKTTEVLMQKHLANSKPEKKWILINLEDVKAIKLMMKYLVNYKLKIKLLIIVPNE